ncbi:MAG: hypothetical protein JWQ07_5136 [Ramlibacter sp.]|nr:hypothetical protein [Ramlibacter sp.]
MAKRAAEPGPICSASRGLPLLANRRRFALRRKPSVIRKIELDDLMIVIANHKLILTTKGAREHVTFHFGPASQVADIHRTTTAADGTIQHVRLWAVRHESLVSAWPAMSVALVTALKNCARPLSIAQMHRGRVAAVVGLVAREQDIWNITTVRRGRLTFQPEKIAENAWAPSYLEELFSLGEDELFTILRCKDRRKPRIIGVGFALKRRGGHRRLMWIAERSIKNVVRDFGRSLAMLGSAEFGVDLHRSVVPRPS